MRYERPATLDDALAIRADAGFRVAAGCTDLFASTERKIRPGDILDITRVAALHGIEADNHLIRILRSHDGVFTHLESKGSVVKTNGPFRFGFLNYR